MLIINHLLGELQVKQKIIFQYHYAICLLNRFYHVFLNQVVINDKWMVDALGNLAIKILFGENKSTNKRCAFQ